MNGRLARYLKDYTGKDEDTDHYSLNVTITRLFGEPQTFSSTLEVQVDMNTQRIVSLSCPWPEDMNSDSIMFSDDFNPNEGRPCDYDKDYSIFLWINRDGKKEDGSPVQPRRIRIYVPDDTESGVRMTGEFWKQLNSKEWAKGEPGMNLYLYHVIQID